MMNLRPFVVCTVVLLVGAHTSSVIAQSAASGPLESLEPTRAEATVAPVETAVEGMPDLPIPEFNSAPFGQGITVVAIPPVDVPPPAIPQEAVTPPSMVASGDHVYFDATLGGGSINSILGSINVYRLGAGPEFRVGYDHRGSDGFNFVQPGKGFFRRTNDLDAWLRLGADQPVSAEIEVEYADQQFGLQQLSPFYSQDLRTISGNIDVNYDPDSVASIEGSFDFRNTIRVLSTGDAGIEAERNAYTSLNPRVVGALEWPRFRVNLTGSYSEFFPGGVEFDRATVLDLRLGIETIPFDGLTLGVAGSTMYRLNDGVYFPIEGYIGYQGSERWDFRVSGGTAAGIPDLVESWREYPLVVVEPGTQLNEESLPTTERVFVSGQLGIVAIPGRLSLRGSTTATHSNDRLIVTDFNDAEDQYEVEIDNTQLIEGSGTVEWNIVESIAVEFGWTGFWGDQLPGVAMHRIDSSISADYNDIGVSLGGRIPLVNNTLPIVDFEGTYRFSRDVDFRIFASDLLGPAMDDGRSLRGVEPDTNDPLIGPGFEVGAAVRVRF